MSEPTQFNNPILATALWPTGRADSPFHVASRAEFDDPIPVRLDSALVEGCRRAALRIGGEKRARIGITSSIRGEGRSTIAAAMSAVYSEAFGRNVLLIAADGRRRPSSAHGWHPETRELGGPGVDQLLLSRAAISDCLQPVGRSLTYLGPGPFEEGAEEVAARGGLVELIAELQSAFDVVIVDLPQLLGDTASVATASACDVTVMVVRAGMTSTTQIREAASILSIRPYLLLNGETSNIPGWLRAVFAR